MRVGSWYTVDLYGGREACPRRWTRGLPRVCCGYFIFNAEEETNSPSYAEKITLTGGSTCRSPHDENARASVLQPHAPAARGVRVTEETGGVRWSREKSDLVRVCWNGRICRSSTGRKGRAPAWAAGGPGARRGHQGAMAGR